MKKEKDIIYARLKRWFVLGKYDNENNLMFSTLCRKYDMGQ